jgi:hypothetical protein
LALFSKYGRIALKVEREETSTADEEEENNKSSSNVNKGSGGDIDLISTSILSSSKSKSFKAPLVPRKPFEKIEFLVRDWQNFDDDEVTQDNEDVIIQEMEAYLKTVLGRNPWETKLIELEELGTASSWLLLVLPYFALGVALILDSVPSLSSTTINLYLAHIATSGIGKKISAWCGGNTNGRRNTTIHRFPIVPTPLSSCVYMFSYSLMHIRPRNDALRHAEISFQDKYTTIK